MTFERPLCRDSNAVRLALVHLSRFATPLWDAIASFAVVDGANERLRHDTAGEIIGDGKSWRRLERGLHEPDEIAMPKRALAEATDAREFERPSALARDV